MCNMLKLIRAVKVIVRRAVFMRFIKWHLGIVGAAFFGIAALSEAFEIELKQEKIAEVAEYGKKYKGKEIFYSPAVQSACFGKYPDGEGGLIMSKYVRIA